MIGSVNGSLPVRCQAIIWTNVDVLVKCEHRTFHSRVSIWICRLQNVRHSIAVSMYFKQPAERHYSDVMWFSWRLRSQTIRLFAQHLTHVNNKEFLDATRSLLVLFGEVRLCLLCFHHKEPVMRKAFPYHDVIIYDLSAVVYHFMVCSLA